MKNVAFDFCRNIWLSTTTYHQPNQEIMTLVQQWRSSKSILVCKRQEKWTRRRWRLWRNRAVETRTLKKKQVASKDMMLWALGLRQVLRIMSNILSKTCRSQISRIGSLSTRTFKATPPSFERLRLGRGLLRMTYLGLPTLCCRRRRELSGFGGVVKVVSDLSGS